MAATAGTTSLCYQRVWTRLTEQEEQNWRRPDALESGPIYYSAMICDWRTLQPHLVVTGANSSKMRTTTARLLALIVSLCQGCPPQAVWQSGPQTVDRRSSVKLSCKFSMGLRLQKPSLTWVRKDENDAETTIYPSDGSTDATKAHMDAEAFKMSMDAGILLSDLRRRDSGWYYCCVTILSGGAQEECRGDGTYLTVRATMYDTLIACSPLGVFGAALLVLHCMVYKQWMEYRRVHARPEIH